MEKFFVQQKVPVSYPVCWIWTRNLNPRKLRAGHRARVSKNPDKTKLGVLRPAGHPFAGQGRRTGFQDAG